MDIQKLREEFEKFPEIADSLGEHIYFGGDNLYHSALVNFKGLVGWLNGAWYAFQEQKKQLDLINQYTGAQGLSIKILNEERIKQQKKINEIKAMAENWINQDYTYNSDSTDIKIQQMKDCGRDIIQKINGE